VARLQIRNFCWKLVRAQKGSDNKQKVWTWFSLYSIVGEPTGFILMTTTTTTTMILSAFLFLFVVGYFFRILATACLHKICLPKKHKKQQGQNPKEVQGDEDGGSKGEIAGVEDRQTGRQRDTERETHTNWLRTASVAAHFRWLSVNRTQMKFIDRNRNRCNNNNYNYKSSSSSDNNSNRNGGG